jgi:hypothetical protein
MTEKKQPDTFIMVEGRQLPAADQPPQSELQAAFKANAAGKITIHMPTAKNVARDLIRAARAEKFRRIDDLRNQAIDDEDAVRRAEVKLKAQKLRDAPSDPRIDAAGNATDLLAAVDAIIAEF